MSQENPTKIKVRIPVLVSRTGEVHTGYFTRSVEGAGRFDHDYCIDSLSDESYNAGYVIVYIIAEIDEAGLFERFEVEGKVEWKR